MESLLLCALPYHGTNEFVRLVQTLALGSTKQGGWMWLAPIQTSGAALPREVLVKRCVNDAVGYARKGLGNFEFLPASSQQYGRELSIGRRLACAPRRLLHQLLQTHRH